jgi:hypothetical protein
MIGHYERIRGSEFSCQSIRASICPFGNISEDNEWISEETNGGTVDGTYRIHAKAIGTWGIDVFWSPWDIDISIQPSGGLLPMFLRIPFHSPQEPRCRPRFAAASIQGRISWGIHGLPKVSLGPAIPYHSTTCGRPTLKRPFGCFRGGLQPSHYPLGYPKLPHAIRPCCLLHLGFRMTQNLRMKRSILNLQNMKF